MSVVQKEINIVIKKYKISCVTKQGVLKDSTVSQPLENFQWLKPGEKVHN